MNIIVCMKIVPEEQDIVVKDDHSLSIDKAASKISLYDLNALEAATALVGEGGKITALTVGGERVKNTKMHKDILSRGADALMLVSDPSLEGVQPETTAKVLAAAARKEGFDLILCGEGSSDLYAQITGVLAAENLDVPVVNYAARVAADGDVLTVDRALDNESEKMSVPLPAVVCVSSDINTPRIPNMKAILQAGKKPVTALTLADLGMDATGAKVATQSIHAPQQKERLNNIVEGDTEDNVAAFAENLRKALN